MTTLFAPLLVLHIALALALLVPAVLLPILLGREAFATADRGSGVRILVSLQGRGSAGVGIGLAVTGLALIAVLGIDLLGQPWLLAGIAIYVVTLAIALLVQRPNLRRLLGRTSDATVPASGDRAALARRLRRVSYLMAALVGVIGFLMSTKPALW